MDMDINETWNDQLIMQFNDGSTLLRNGGRNGNNTAFIHENIGVDETFTGIHGSALQQQTHSSWISSHTYSIYFIEKGGACQPSPPGFPRRGKKRKERQEAFPSCAENKTKNHTFRCGSGGRYRTRTYDPLHVKQVL